ncbi:MAG: phosphoenolpyruvate carboxykinase (ATP) [bacterium]
MNSFHSRLKEILDKHPNIQHNPPRRQLIKEAVERREALVANPGCLATWTPADSTGRSPQDTVTVLRPESEGKIDWSSPNNLPITPETFEMLFSDALKRLAAKPRLYYLERVIGADVNYSLPLRIISDRALHSLFCDNMFLPVPPDIHRSLFAQSPFTLIALPYDRLDADNYNGRLRRLTRTGKTSTMAIAIDYDNYLGIVFGSAYCGTIKKLMFTVMNYLLPEHGILPLHCAANEGNDGGVTLFLGLSGTGKTSLSADPRRKLLGDDEHGWSDNGIANFENGCYAKLINLDPKKEPDIYHACFHEANYLEHGAIVENVLVYPDGTFDLADSRLTENSRGSYPRSFLTNIKTTAIGGHPKTIIFLTADANGVLPPVAKLSREQAMFWFLLGYTSKLAGTETGIIEPKSTFSRFFGQPFMPRKPEDYTHLLGEKLKCHNTRVYLINTGWIGGPYGIGKRIDIKLTREIVQAAIAGELEKVNYETEPFFHLQLPSSCPNIENTKILNPKNTWENISAYEERAKKLNAEFKDYFHRAYENRGWDPTVFLECPGD